MSYAAILTDDPHAGEDEFEIGAVGAILRSLHVASRGVEAPTSHSYDATAEPNSQPISLWQEHPRFEPLKPERPATFAYATSKQAISQMESVLGSLVRENVANARALEQTEEALQARDRSLRRTRKRLRKLAGRLLHAQEEERRLIAREMHDDWTQRLAILGIDIAKLEKHLGAPKQALPLLRTMQDQLVSLSEDVHALSRQLHPSILDDLGLVEALRSECASFSRREAIAVLYRPQECPDTLPREVALCVYRVAQEALRNVAKHADTDEAVVSLIRTDAKLLLRVQDEGVGFDPAALRSKPGLGLSSMKERVRLIQAKLCISSAPGQGTSVEVCAPLARNKP